ncbi:MAG TPA: hypothetical protein PJ982_03095 [Lacipirellulaceae bacterium]|nr:hypothetical protein [Lacipirellulaceae bacterium]
MDDARPTLPADIETAVALHHGGPVAIAGQRGDHVVMSMAIFRDLMGVGADEDFAASVEGIRSSLAQAAAGQTMMLDEAAQRLAQKYGA